MQVMLLAVAVVLVLVCAAFAGARLARRAGEPCTHRTVRDVADVALVTVGVVVTAPILLCAFALACCVALFQRLQT